MFRALGLMQNTSCDSWTLADDSSSTQTGTKHVRAVKDSWAEHLMLVRQLSSRTAQDKPPAVLQRPAG